MAKLERWPAPRVVLVGAAAAAASLALGMVVMGLAAGPPASTGGAAPDCVAAVEHAEVAIGHLRAGTRGHRLDESLARFATTARRCREQAAG